MVFAVVAAVSSFFFQKKNALQVKKVALKQKLWQYLLNMKDSIDLYQEIAELRSRLNRSKEALKSVRTVAKIYGDGRTKFMETANQGFKDIVSIANRGLTD
jgi:hypothetical protein